MARATCLIIALVVFGTIGCATPQAKADREASISSVCGGIAGKQCPTGLYCSFGNGSAAQASTCGSGDQSGQCVPTPEVCVSSYEPVCGCDRKTYSNACNANSSGVTVLAPGECATAK